MEFVAGTIYKDPSLPELSPEDRRKVYGAMNQTIAKIHSVDVEKAGIADYGKHGQLRIIEKSVRCQCNDCRRLRPQAGADLVQAVRGK